MKADTPHLRPRVDPLFNPDTRLSARLCPRLVHPCLLALAVGGLLIACDPEEPPEQHRGLEVLSVEPLAIGASQVGSQSHSPTEGEAGTPEAPGKSAERTASSKGARTQTTLVSVAASQETATRGADGTDRTAGAPSTRKTASRRGTTSSPSGFKRSQPVSIPAAKTDRPSVYRAGDTPNPAAVYTPPRAKPVTLDSVPSRAQTSQNHPANTSRDPTRNTSRTTHEPNRVVAIVPPSRKPNPGKPNPGEPNPGEPRPEEPSHGKSSSTDHASTGEPEKSAATLPNLTGDQQGKSAAVAPDLTGEPEKSAATGPDLTDNQPEKAAKQQLASLPSTGSKAVQSSHHLELSSPSNCQVPLRASEVTRLWAIPSDQDAFPNARDCLKAHYLHLGELGEAERAMVELRNLPAYQRDPYVLLSLAEIALVRGERDPSHLGRALEYVRQAELHQARLVGNVYEQTVRIQEVLGKTRERHYLLSKDILDLEKALTAWSRCASMAEENRDSARATRARAHANRVRIKLRTVQ